MVDAERVSPDKSTAFSEDSDSSPTKKKRRQSVLFFAGGDSSSSSSASSAQTYVVEWGEMNLSTLLTEWYCKSLYRADTISSGSAVKSELVKVAKLMCICRRFLPSGTAIAARPEGGTELSAWEAYIKELATSMEKEALRFINSPEIRRLLKPDQKQKPDSTSKPRKQAKVLSMYRAFMQLALADLPPAVLLTDAAWVQSESSPGLYHEVERLVFTPHVRRDDDGDALPQLELAGELEELLAGELLELGELH